MIRYLKQFRLRKIRNERDYDRAYDIFIELATFEAKRKKPLAGKLRVYYDRLFDLIEEYELSG